ncbi:MAG: hypothetical protein A2X61_00755 [Ignavibacteria bacterium GWB2_35_12]|nr:MAG: hypothetical protein A2X61_00755 [Ignavibacteria bacterium GWB2_35_12]OGU87531.1 MAG: hypothetical protein A2220_15515 [Ignavibacteria bacterium RIFOXYA2_FULL_35_10]OGV21722.1 MAG: hypothetical protein A2475_03980 [Ignavibacteria bacterium RIFOXYC2_FULL_35_21]
MFNKYLKLNMKILSNEIAGLNLFKENQLKKNEEFRIKLDLVLANQELLFMLIKKLADCFQLEYVNGRYISKRKNPK